MSASVYSASSRVYGILNKNVANVNYSKSKGQQQQKMTLIN